HKIKRSQQPLIYEGRARVSSTHAARRVASHNRDQSGRITNTPGPCVHAPVLMPSKTNFDTSAAIRLRSPSRFPPDASHDAFSSSLTTPVFSQRNMRRFDTTPRRAMPKGHNPSSPTQQHIDRGLLPTSQPLPLRAWHTHDLGFGRVQPQPDL